ncbi:MAG: hypothetical protein AAFV93_15425, partial [Chloroflexota bacterium]
MQAKNYTAQALLTDIENKDITQLQVPLEYQQAGRESIAALIETTLDALPDDAKAVFIAWGAFFSPQITPELLAWYFVDLPEIMQDEIDELRSYQDEGTSFTDEEFHSYLWQKQINTLEINELPTNTYLDILQQFGLAQRQHAQQTADGRPVQVASYRLHDLGFEYAQAQNDDNRRNRAVDACLAHIARYK